MLLQFIIFKLKAFSCYLSRMLKIENMSRISKIVLRQNLFCLNYLNLILRLQVHIGSPDLGSRKTKSVIRNI